MASKNQDMDLAQLDETGSRVADRRSQETEPGEEKRKTQRRRLIDPTTCERDYSNDEIEFMQAMDEYKRRSGRMFPTCSEILEVIRGIGYRKVETWDDEIEVSDDDSIEERLEQTIDCVEDDLDF